MIATNLVMSSIGTARSTGGIGPFIIYPALFAGLYAVWKWNPDDKNGNYVDKEVLKKD